MTKHAQAAKTKGIIRGDGTGAGTRIYNFFIATYRKTILSLFLFSAMAMPVMADASAADAKWDTVVGFIVPWIARAGGLLLLFGGIELGVAFKDDNADKKTNSIRFIIAGLIAIAVGLSSDLFLK